MKFPEVPVMLQIMSGVTDPSKLLPLGSVYELPPNKSIQLSFPTEDGTLAAPVCVLSSLRANHGLTSGS